MSVQVSTRIDKETKAQFDHICEAIGVSPSNALSMFIKGVINFNGIPFSVVVPTEGVKQNLAIHTTPKEKMDALEAMRELMEDIDGSDIDLKQLRAERREARYDRERNG